MAAKSLDKVISEKIVADWRTGAYSQQKLADKHKVSKGAVNKLCKNVEQNMTAIVTAGVQYKSGLTGQGDRIVTAVNEVIDVQLGYRKRRNTIADIAYNRIETELQNCEPFLIKQLVEATDKVGVMVDIAPRFATPGSLNLQNNVGVNVSLKDELETARKRMNGNAINQAGS